MLFAGEALFLGRGDQLAVAQQGDSAIVVIGGDAEQIHRKCGIAADESRTKGLAGRLHQSNIRLRFGLSRILNSGQTGEMCGRYTLRRNGDAIRRELRAEAAAALESWAPRYNIAPTNQVPVLLRDKSGARLIELMGWGIPRDRNGRTVRQINGRSESFAIRNPRCAVISDGFYEWGAKGPNRQPYFFHRPADELILIAGHWQSLSIGRTLQSTFVILTTAANGMIAPIHDRMPAILDGDALALWLNPSSSERDLSGLLAPTDETLAMRPASPLVNSVKNEGPELLGAI